MDNNNNSNNITRNEEQHDNNNIDPMMIRTYCVDHIPPSHLNLKQRHNVDTIFQQIFGYPWGTEFELISDPALVSSSSFLSPSSLDSHQANHDDYINSNNATAFIGTCSRTTTMQHSNEQQQQQLVALQQLCRMFGSRITAKILYQTSSVDDDDDNNNNTNEEDDMIQRKSEENHEDEKRKLSSVDTVHEEPDDTVPVSQSNSSHHHQSHSNRSKKRRRIVLSCHPSISSSSSSLSSPYLSFDSTLSSNNNRSMSLLSPSSSSMVHTIHSATNYDNSNHNNANTMMDIKQTTLYCNQQTDETLQTSGPLLPSTSSYPTSSGRASSSSIAASGGGSGGGGVDQILQQIAMSGTKLSTVAKTSADWDTYTNSVSGLRNQLEEHIESNDAYLKKQDFLVRVDHRQFNIEKTKRNQERAKRGK
jgi:Bucentaur or craniofacial development